MKFRIRSFLVLLVFVLPLVSCAGKTTTTSDDSSRNASDVSSRTSCFGSAPKWYRDQLPNSDNNLIKTGYGCGDNLEVAKNKALDNAARQLGVKVSSSRRRNLQEVSSKKEAIEENYAVNTTVKATHRIKDFTVARREEANGFYYVAYQLDRRPLREILLDDLMDEIGPENVPLRDITWKGTRTLIESRLVGELENRLINESNGTKSIELAIDLRRDRDRWLLTVGGIHTTIDNPDFSRLLNWDTQRGDDLKLDLITSNKSRNSNRLQAGDTFYFRVKNTKSEGGHFALFNIYADGRVCVLKQSTPLKSVGLVPAKEAMDRGQIFTAVPLEEGKPTLDVYLAVYSPEPFRTTKFLYLSEGKQMCNTEKSYQMDELFEWLDQTDVTATDATVVQILPRTSS